MAKSVPFRNWLISLAACAVASLLSIAYVDRPVADYVHLNLLQSHIIQGLASALGPLVIFVALAFLVLVGTGCWVLAGRNLSPRFEASLLCSWSTVWAMASTEILKRIFGRSDPEMWTGFSTTASAKATYAFHFLHGGPLFESFPSGTMAIAAAILSVLWILMPRLRAAWALLLAFVAFALIVTNGHFVADVIGGGFLGVSIGWMTFLLWLQRPSGI
jgi:membrane-associated phospholipid phosphatase